MTLRSLLTLVVVLATVAPMTAAGKQPYVEGDSLEFALLDLDGHPVRSSDERFRDKVLLVDLWGTWCPPCLTEIPTLAALQGRYRDRGLVIVAVAFEDESEPGESRRARLREFVETQGIGYLVLDGRAPLEGDEAFPALRNVPGLPVEIFVGRDGRVVEARTSSGYSKRWARKLERTLLELLDDAP